MKRLLALAGLLISLVCAFFFARAFANHWAAISASDWNSSVWWTMALAALMYASTYLPVSYAWNCSLTALGHRLPYPLVVTILAISQIGKYFPGNVGHHVGRVVLTKRAGVPAEAVLGSMLVDTLIVLFAAALWSLWVLQLLLRVLHDQGDALKHATLFVLALGITGLLLTTLLPPARRAARQQVRRLRQLIDLRNLPLLGSALLAHTISFITGGTVLFLLCGTFSRGGEASSWTEVSGIYSGAWLLGFLIPGAPAGLGIREVALLFGLSPIYGKEVATVVAASMRLITTASDGIVFALALSLGRNRAKEADATAKGH